jgi:hypothetical protein
MLFKLANLSIMSGIGNMLKSIASLFLLSILSVGLFFISTNSCAVQANSEIPKLSVPEFTADVKDDRIVLKIKNQPFESYYNPDRGLNVNLYYNLRYKTSGDWEEVYRPSDFYLTPDLGSEYTTISFPASNSITFVTDGRKVTVHFDEIQFQAEAMIGTISRQATDSALLAPWVFNGETSGWSETQTVTVESSDPTTPNQPTATDNESYSLEQIAVILGVVATVIAVDALGTGLAVYFKVRKHY